MQTTSDTLVLDTTLISIRWMTYLKLRCTRSTSERWAGKISDWRRGEGEDGSLANKGLRSQFGEGGKMVVVLRGM